MRLLLDDKFAPITSTYGFFNTGLDVVVQALSNWKMQILQKYQQDLLKRDVHGSLEDVLSKLCPLTVPVNTKFLILNTRGPWTAYFDNGAGGTDAAGVVAVLSKDMGVRCVRLTAIPNTMPAKVDYDTKGRYGGCIFELYNENGDCERTVGVANDGGKWRFDVSGNPLSFENLTVYKARKIVDRFTFRMADQYLNAIEVSPFSEEFYSSNGITRGYLFETKGNLPDTIREFTLEEVRTSFGEGGEKEALLDGIEEGKNPRAKVR